MVTKQDARESANILCISVMLKSNDTGEDIIRLKHSNKIGNINIT